MLPGLVKTPAAICVVAGNHDVVWNLEDKRIALFGLSFKAGTDDVRESPSLRLARRLLEAGAEVVGYDPQGMEGAVQETPGLQVADDPYAGVAATWNLKRLPAK